MLAASIEMTIMRRWAVTLAAILGGVLAMGTATVLVGRQLWHRDTTRAVHQLRWDHGPAVAAALSREARAALPPPVARYFDLVLPPGQAPIEEARIRWSGDFQMRPGGGWAPFTAEQHFVVRPPGFVWDAEIRMAPLLWVRVRDGYSAGQGTMLGRVGGVVPVVDVGGTPEMAESALVRWLGEAVWFPTALLPGTAGGGVHWEAVDDLTARATVTDGVVRASADFHFAPGGEAVRMTAQRYRDVNGTALLTPFEGRYHEYTRHNGVLVPAQAEVAWLLPEGRFPYWRGHPETIEYAFSLPARRAIR